jgi:hypothetical protein
MVWAEVTVETVGAKLDTFASVNIENIIMSKDNF